MKRVWRGGSSKRSGFLAGVTIFAAVTFLYLNFEPAPAGADRKHRRIEITRLAATIEAAPKPATSVAPAPVNSPADGKKGAVAQGPTEFDRIAMFMNMILLEQGRRRLGEASDYTCTFFKQERLGTELSEGQIMELKMRHKPFSVYMKWLNGEKGR